MNQDCGPHPLSHRESSLRLPARAGCAVTSRLRSLLPGFVPCPSLPLTHMAAWKVGYPRGSDEETEAQPGHVTHLTCDLQPGGGWCTDVQPRSQESSYPDHEEVTGGGLARAGLHAWVLLMRCSARRASRTLTGLPWEPPGLLEAGGETGLVGTASHGVGRLAPTVDFRVAETVSGRTCSRPQ